MIPEEFLSILACPETKQGLSVAEIDLRDKVIARVGEGSLLNLSGIKVDGPVTDVLIREDKQVIYIVRNGIPILLVEEGIKADLS